MDRIVIEVEDRVARKWRDAAPEVKDQVGKDLGKKLDEILDGNRERDLDFNLKLARQEAASNGLTEEILQKLLNEE
ncbi:hypothetical protein DSL64_14495 [Dyadobacter luteus]|uniref:Uncharacterized protein n=1 Tax=Dyadobacter luteus TaxID=2259619 RepID=A0A3D8YAL9_9BACT|nr:hypothetical protein [Dyadobacter luteus]REA60735.1 hypothetical protein DSL64_14495 [Dyadobacter luteus]